MRIERVAAKLARKICDELLGGQRRRGDVDRHGKPVPLLVPSRTLITRRPEHPLAHGDDQSAQFELSLIHISAFVLSLERM